MKRYYEYKNLSISEIEEFKRLVLLNPGLFNAETLCAQISPHVGSLYPDFYSSTVVNRTVDALTHRQPFSAIRIGDGEANIMGLEIYPTLPNLCRLAFESVLFIQNDTFEFNEAWASATCAMVNASLLSADVVGIIGLQGPNKNEAEVADFSESLEQNSAGVFGHWRARHLMRRYSIAGIFSRKTVASAHFYFSFLIGLREVVKASEAVICMTDKTEAVQRLKRLAGKTSVSHIKTGEVGGHERCLSQRPDFLFETKQKLPHNLAGNLVLIGAGPWAEIYCHWVKERGGVAVDIGSGFDLIAGKRTRPVHSAVNPTIFDRIEAVFET